MACSKLPIAITDLENQIRSGKGRGRCWILAATFPIIMGNGDPMSNFDGVTRLASEKPSIVSRGRDALPMGIIGID